MRNDNWCIKMGITGRKQIDLGFWNKNGIYIEEIVNMTEDELLQEYCTDYNTMVSPIDILQKRIAELEAENEILCNQYKGLLKQNKKIQEELSNYKRVD